MWLFTKIVLLAIPACLGLLAAQMPNYVNAQQTTVAEGQKLILGFRMMDWKAKHIHQSAEVGQLTTLYRSLACEVENYDHSGHTDVRYRCPEWMEFELPSHEAAHKWQDFLQNAGFETAHEH